METDSYLGLTLAGRYTITRKIGAGGMGAVYLASQATLNRQVAVKFLQVGGQVTPEMVQRFEQEARIVAGLHHPNIVAIHDYGLYQGTPYMVMEYVDGTTLADRLDEHGALPLVDALAIVRQVLDALAEAHARKIVHRDLKPANLMLLCRGLSRHLVKVLDFGIARIVSENESEECETSKITRTGLILGSPKTISPEQIAGAPADVRSDLYSLGVILYLMLSGRYPFIGPTPMSILYQHHHDPPPPLPVEVCPEPVRRVLDRALAKNPAQRYSSAQSMAEEIDRLASTLSDVRSALRPLLARPGRRSAVRSWLGVVGLASGLALLCTVVVLALIFSYRQPAAPGPQPTAGVESGATAARAEPRLVMLRLSSAPSGLEVVPLQAEAGAEVLGRTPLTLTLPEHAFPWRVRFRQGSFVSETAVLELTAGQREVSWHADLQAALRAATAGAATGAAEAAAAAPPPPPPPPVRPTRRAAPAAPVAAAGPRVQPAVPAFVPPPIVEPVPPTAGAAPGQPAPAAAGPSSPPPPAAAPAAPGARRAIVVPTVDEAPPAKGAVPLVDEPAAPERRRPPPPAGHVVPSVD